MKQVHRIRCTFWLAGILFGRVSFSGEVFANEQDDDGITVELALSVETFDPLNPAGVLTCTVLNQTAVDLTLPAWYDNSTIQLLGQGTSNQQSGNVSGHSWRLTQWIKTPGNETVTICPGQSTVLFQLELAEIPGTREQGNFLAETQPAESRWRWERKAHPMPPDSPIHQFRASGYTGGVNFRVDIRQGDKTIRSDDIHMNVMDVDAIAGYKTPVVNEIMRPVPIETTPDVDNCQGADHLDVVTDGSDFWYLCCHKIPGHKANQLRLPFERK